MNEVLKLFVSLSLSGSILACIMLALKPFIRERVSQKWQYYIWLIIVFRFLLPFTPEVSLVGSVFSYPGAYSTINSLTEQIPSEASDAYTASNNVDSGSNGANTADRQDTKINLHIPNYLRDIFRSIGVLWIAAAAMILILKITRYRSFLRYIKAGARQVSDTDTLEAYLDACRELNIKKPLPILVNNLAASPMLAGTFRPVIIIPNLDIEKNKLLNVFKHELIHYKRLDIFYKWIIQITICLHFFNPLIYIIGRVINRHCELSCDETILNNLDEEDRLAYGDTLVTSLKSAGNYNDLVVSMSLSENAALLKERLGAIMNFQKRSKFSALISLILTVIMICAATVTGAYASVSITAKNNSIILNENNAVIEFKNYYVNNGIFEWSNKFIFNSGGEFVSTVDFTVTKDMEVQVSAEAAAKTGHMSLYIQRIEDTNWYDGTQLTDENGKVRKKLFEVSGEIINETRQIFLEKGTYLATFYGSSLNAASYNLVLTPENKFTESRPDYNDTYIINNNYYPNNKGYNIYAKSIHDIANIAHIVRQEILNDIARSSATTNIGELSGIAPFVSQDVLDELTRNVSPSNIDELSGIAPFVSQDVLNELTRNVSPSNINELSDIAPFVSQDVLNELTRNVSPSNINELSSIAPFVSQEALDKLARNVSPSNIDELSGIAPFVSQDVLDELARKVSPSNIDEISSIAPFVSQDVLNELTRNVSPSNIDELSSIAPFISQEALDKLARNVSPANIDELSSIAPFISQEALDKLARNVSPANIKELSSIAPFVSQEALDELARKVSPANIKELSSIAPFISQDVLNELLIKRID